MQQIWNSAPKSSVLCRCYADHGYQVHEDSDLFSRGYSCSQLHSSWRETCSFVASNACADGWCPASAFTTSSQAFAPTLNVLAALIKRPKERCAERPSTLLNKVENANTRKLKGHYFWRLEYLRPKDPHRLLFQR